MPQSRYSIILKYIYGHAIITIKIDKELTTVKIHIGGARKDDRISSKLFTLALEDCFQFKMLD